MFFQVIFTSLIYLFPGIVGASVVCSSLFKGPGIQFDAAPEGRRIFVPSVSSDFVRLTDFLLDKQNFPQANIISVGTADAVRIDEQYVQQVTVRQRAFAAYGENVFQVAEGVNKARFRRASHEILLDVANTLVKNYPQYFSIRGRTLHNHILQTSVPLTNAGQVHPLARAGQLVQEDLIVVTKNRKGEYILAGGFLASATNWNINWYAGVTMAEIHRGFGNEAMIENMLDRLQPGGPFARNNWNVYEDATLSQFSSSRFGRYKFEAPPVSMKHVEDHIYVRFEYQTLSRLRKNQDHLLFTIRPYTYRIGDMMQVEGVAQSLANGIVKKHTSPEGKLEVDEYTRLVLRYLRKEGYEPEADSSSIQR